MPAVPGSVAASLLSSPLLSHVLQLVHCFFIAFPLLIALRKPRWTLQIDQAKHFATTSSDRAIFKDFTF